MHFALQVFAMVPRDAELTNRSARTTMTTTHFTIGQRQRFAAPLGEFSLFVCFCLFVCLFVCLFACLFVCLCLSLFCFCLVTANAKPYSSLCFLLASLGFVSWVSIRHKTWDCIFLVSIVYLFYLLNVHIYVKVQRASF